MPSNRPSERILGSNAVLKFITLGGTPSDLFVELDKFSAKAVDEKKDYKPNGHTLTTNHLIHKGWEISLECGITNDAKLIAYLMSIYSHNSNAAGGYVSRRGGSVDNIAIVITQKYFNDKTTVFSYDNCLLYDLNVDCGMQNDEIRLTLTACCSSRTVSNGFSKTTVPSNATDYINGVVPRVAI